MARSTNNLSRRDFAKLLSGGAAASALLPFLPRQTYAQGSGAPERIIVIFHGLGYLENSFWPTAGASESDFTLGETQTVLEPYRDRLIYPDGMTLYGGPYYFPDDDNEHGTGAAMTFTASLKNGYATGPSFEQMIADHWDAQASRPFRHIGLGVNGNASQHTACFFTGDQQPVTPQNSPQGAFDSLFDALPTDPGDSVAIERLRAQRQSVIDVVREDLLTVQNKIGAQENQILEAHLDHLRSLEQRVVEFESACTAPDAPNPSGDDASEIEAQMDIIASALACDLTQVVTLQLGHCDGAITMFDGVNAHDNSHAVGDAQGTPEYPAVLEQHRDIDRWWADRWLYLLDRLDAIQEVNGSLLDNTLIVWGHDTTSGQSISTGPHRHWRMPYWMAGGRNWAFPTGRYLQLPHPNSVSQEDFELWPSHSRMYTSILQRAGLDVDTFGNMDPGSGTLTGL